MERFRYTLSERALKLYEGYGAVKDWVDELVALRSGGRAAII
ncbi:MAG: hypothetical protein N3F10_06305 [Candidatus Bathyarchaeota archaeon]|nr:hypothetical protein [Candidatus Bathyarchaeota archaeon]